MIKFSHADLKPPVILAVAAGLLYNFWIFGYILDSEALHDTYFSVLEAYHRPYSWLFIAADVVTSLLVFTVGSLLWRAHKARQSVIISYLLFGAATLLDATVPIADKCSSNIGACGISPGQVVSFHDLASLVAYLSIFYGLLSAKRLIRARKLRSRIDQWVKLTFYAWCLAGLFLLFSIIVNRYTAPAQGLFLGLIGLGLVVMPIAVLASEKSQPSSV